MASTFRAGSRRRKPLFCGVHDGGDGGRGAGVKIQRVQLATRGGPTGSLNMRDLVGQHLTGPSGVEKDDREKNGEPREQEAREREGRAATRSRSCFSAA